MKGIFGVLKEIFRFIFYDGYNLGNVKGFYISIFYFNVTIIFIDIYFS